MKYSAATLGFRLLIVTAVAGLALGTAEKITREPIARETARQHQAGLKETLPAAERFEPYTGDLSGYPLVQGAEIGYAGDRVVGADLTVASNGYGGPVTFLVGIDTDGIITGLKVTNHTETPGLGANAATQWFQDRFKGLSGTLEVVKGEVSKETSSASESPDTQTGASKEADSQTSASKEAETGGKPATSQIQAITGATVTSSAVTRGVNQALSAFEEKIKGEVLK